MNEYLIYFHVAQHFSVNSSPPCCWYAKSAPKFDLQHHSEWRAAGLCALVVLISSLHLSVCVCGVRQNHISARRWL